MAGTGSFSGNPVRVQTFGYDANARLTSERNYKGVQLAAFLGNPAAAATETTAYTYDNVGNRTATTVTTATGSTSPPPTAGTATAAWPARAARANTPATPSTCFWME